MGNKKSARDAQAGGASGSQQEAQQAQQELPGFVEDAARAGDGEASASAELSTAVAGRPGGPAKRSDRGDGASTEAASREEREVQLDESGRTEQHEAEEEEEEQAAAATQEHDPESGDLTYRKEVGEEEGGLPQHEAVELARDVLTASSAVPTVKKAWRDRHLRLMFVGGAGLGKTTVIRNLLGAYAGDAQLRIKDATGPEASAGFLNNPDRFVTTLVVKDFFNLTCFHYRVVDTPGLDYLDGGIEPILEVLKGAQLRHFEVESDRMRSDSIDKYSDARVDAVVFFLPPHRLVERDLAALVRVAELAPVVPVLAKADSMTRDELTSYRATVRKALDKASKGLHRPLTATFSAEALSEANAPPKAPPFSVIGADQNDPSYGRWWPVREFAWGRAFSFVHSDLGSLKRLLFEVSFEELKADTERRYYKWRGTHLKKTSPDMPTDKGTIVEHLLRALTAPDSGEARRLRHLLRNVAGAGVVVLVATLGRSYMRGGRREVEQDLGKLQEAGKEAVSAAAHTAARGAEVAAAKAKETTETLVEATKEQAPVEKTKRVGLFFRKKVKAVVHRLEHGSAEAEARARAEAEAAERKRRRGRFNPLRIFSGHK